jgi:hypothetical protein
VSLPCFRRPGKPEKHATHALFGLVLSSERSSCELSQLCAGRDLARPATTPAGDQYGLSAGARTGADAALGGAGTAAGAGVGFGAASSGFIALGATGSLATAGDAELDAIGSGDAEPDAIGSGEAGVAVIASSRSRLKM